MGLLVTQNGKRGNTYTRVFTVKFCMNGALLDSHLNNLF